MKTNDRLRDLLTTELETLVKERDGARKKSLQYKEIAEAVDKQVNRLQHFLADYGPVNAIPTDPDISERVKPMSVIKPRITEEVLAYLKEQYPNAKSAAEIKANLTAMGMKLSSDTLVRLQHRGAIEKVDYVSDGRGYTYRLVVEGQTVDKKEVSVNG